MCREIEITTVYSLLNMDGLEFRFATIMFEEFSCLMSPNCYCMNIHNEYVKGQSSCMFILVPACTDIATITCMFICMHMLCNKVSVDYIYMQVILILAIASEMAEVNLIDTRNLLVSMQSACILFC